MRIARPLLLVLLLAAGPAWAQEGAGAPPPIDPAVLDKDSLMIGVGAGQVPSYEGSDDTVWSVVPGIRGRVSRINFTIRGNRAWADIVPTRGGPGWDFQAGPLINVNFNRSAAIKDPRVLALGRINTAIELGGFLGIGKQGVITSDYDKLTVSVGYVHDVNKVHSSYIVTPSIDYGTPLSRKAYVGLSFSGDYMGEGYANTYFSVTPAGSVASGLPAYDARKGWKDWTVGALGNLSLTGDLTHGLSLIGAVSYRRMLNSAKDSPLTSVAGSPDQWVFAGGLAYTF